MNPKKRAVRNDLHFDGTISLADLDPDYRILLIKYSDYRTADRTVKNIPSKAIFGFPSAKILRQTRNAISPIAIHTKDCNASYEPAVLPLVIPAQASQSGRMARKENRAREHQPFSIRYTILRSEPACPPVYCSQNSPARYAAIAACTDAAKTNTASRF